jgi:hypothetical protein
MHKVTALLGLALLGTAAAHAQQTRPGVAVPPNTPGYTYGKAEDAGEARMKSRAQGQLPAPAGDAPRSAEGGAVGNDQSAVAGQERIKERNARRPDKRRPPTY